MQKGRKEQEFGKNSRRNVRARAQGQGRGGKGPDRAVRAAHEEFELGASPGQEDLRGRISADVEADRPPVVAGPGQGHGLDGLPAAREEAGRTDQAHLLAELRACFYLEIDDGHRGDRPWRN